jgi:exopolyphosphatase / guanosine-5'-triphosphate,3'-diphosphate pyrophosphatase
VSAVRPGRLAVVDLGSNSTRLFLCTGQGPDGPEGERLTRVTALRRGAATDGALAADALARTEACLADFAPRLRAFAPERLLALGTSAIRDAPNRDLVAGMVERRLGAGLVVLSGAEEAALAYRGARLALGPGAAGPALVVDIGGGSTELVHGGPAGPPSAASLQVGSVRSGERHLAHDPPLPDELDALRGEVSALAEPVLAGIEEPGPLVGVAGTFTTLAAITLGAYDPALVHGLRLRRAEVEAMLARLAALPLEARRGVPGLHPDRAPAIVAGTAIAAAMLEAAGAPKVLVSERDLLDGAVLAADELGAARIS